MDYIKTYRVELTVKGPVYIGSGNEISKKEYMMDNGGKSVNVLDINKVYLGVKKKALVRQYEEYMLNNNMDIYTWFKNNGIKPVEIKPWIKYSIEAGDRLSINGRSRLHIQECIKDAFGKPYIPGSSLKGMIRTALLEWTVSNCKDDYKRIISDIQYNIPQYKGRNIYLKRDIESVESEAFRVLARNEKRRNDAVNDILSGLIVSDSEPLEMSDIVLCQKIDVSVDGNENPLGIVRECIKPETKVDFNISIDTTLCDYDDQSILCAIEECSKIIGDNFISKFTVADYPKKNNVWIGGGSGFLSKTIVYNLFPKDEGVKNTQKIFDITKVPAKHKHYKDDKIGVAPHMIKCTRYKGKLYQFGLCEFSIKNN